VEQPRVAVIDDERLKPGVTEHLLKLIVSVKDGNIQR
jgi:hypothetical protein